MMSVKFSFAYFYGESVHDAFFFAHTKDEWVRGDETTDYLAYFGFTSGLLHPNGTKRYPVYLNDKKFIHLPILTGKDVFKHYVADLQSLIHDLNKEGYTLSRMVVARILSNVCTITQHLISNPLFWDIVNSMLDKDLPLVESFCVVGIDEERNYYIGICLPGQDDSIATAWPWNACCQTGSDAGARRTLHTLNRRAFTSNYDPSHLESLSKMLDGIYPHIVI